MTSNNVATLDTGAINDLAGLKNALGEYAKDIKLNLSSVLRVDPGSGLSQKQIAATALASAYATKHQDVIRAIEAETAEYLEAEDVNAAKAAATIMGMNNIYYRFVHLVEDREYGKMPAGLRMNVIGNPGVEKTDFELYSLAVSAINGCGMCIESHVQQVEKHGISKAGVQHSIKIASVLNATAQALIIG